MPCRWRVPLERSQVLESWLTGVRLMAREMRRGPGSHAMKICERPTSYITPRCGAVNSLHQLATPSARPRPNPLLCARDWRMVSVGFAQYQAKLLARVARSVNGQGRGCCCE